jgi:hypothetical protein
MSSCRFVGFVGYESGIELWRGVAEMRDEIIFMVEESAEGGVEARALDHSIYTEADTFEELKESVRDAVRCHFDADDLPRIIRLHMVRDEVLSV